MKLGIIVLVIIVSTAAVAQQQPPTAIDRITYALSQCIKASEEAVDRNNQLQLKIIQMEAEIKKLKEKEPVGDKKNE